LEDFAGRIAVDYERFEQNLNIDALDVKSNYRRQGLAKQLFQKILEKHPDVVSVSSVLTNLNVAAYKAHKAELVRGRHDFEFTYEDDIETVKKTPAYRIRASFGFTKILKYSRTKTSITLVVGREDQ